MLKHAAGDLAMWNGRSHMDTPSDTQLRSQTLVNCPKNDITATGLESSNL